MELHVYQPTQSITVLTWMSSNCSDKIGDQHDVSTVHSIRQCTEWLSNFYA